MNTNDESFYNRRHRRRPLLNMSAWEDVFLTNFSAVIPESQSEAMPGGITPTANSSGAGAAGANPPRAAVGKAKGRAGKTCPRGQCLHLFAKSKSSELIILSAPSVQLSHCGADPVRSPRCEIPHFKQQIPSIELQTLSFELQTSDFKQQTWNFKHHYQKSKTPSSVHVGRMRG